MNHRLFAAFITLFTATFVGAQSAPTTNLGGACTVSGFNITLGFPVAPVAGNPFTVTIANTGGPGSTGGGYFPVAFLVAGFSDPNMILPGCGCVAHATLDVFWVGNMFPIQIQLPASAVGHAFNMQGGAAVVPTYGPLVLPTGLCHVSGIDLWFTDAWRIQVQ